MQCRSSIYRSIAEATFLLDLVASTKYAVFVPSIGEVVEKMKANLARDVKNVEAAKVELESLTEIADKIYELEKTVDHGSMRIVRIIELLKDKKTKANVLKNPNMTRIHDSFEGRGEIKRPVKLRVAIEEYLRVVDRAKVGEIVEFLQAIGLDYAKRQTVESVIKRNSFDFTVTKQGREKFISRNQTW
jgi:hypothetical protein